MKKKKSKSMYLVLTFLLLLVAGFTTYAIYKTSATGTANVSAANWVVKVTANSTTTNVTGGSNNINLGVCATHLAPGSSCTIPFTVDMTESEVDSILTVGIGNGINQDTLALMNEAGLSLKISDGTSEGYAYALNYGTTKVLNLIIDWEAGDEDDDNKASADVALSKTVGTLTIPVNMTVRQFNGLTRTVTFNKNSEDSNIETPSSIQVTDGGAISNIPDLNSESVVFIGWYTSPTGGAKLTNTTPIIDDITYYAHYGTYKTVTFNTHGGSEVSPISVGEGRSMSSLPESTKTGYYLVGWFTEEENGTKLTTSTIIDSDIEYHAQWRVNPVYTVGQAVYFDPTKSDQTECNDIDHTGATCMRWRVISVGDTANNSTVNLQLDHNLINTTRWNETKKSYDGPITVFTSLANETAAWENVSLLNYTYDTTAVSPGNYGILTCTNGSCTVNGSSTPIVTGLKARMITGEEVAAITSTQPNVGSDAKYWTLASDVGFYFSNNGYKIGTKNTSGAGNTNLSWLIENTLVNSNSGATSNGTDNHGYWTLSPRISQMTDQVYVVRESGSIGSAKISDTYTNNVNTSSDYYGIRPVITIPKSKLQ